MCDLASPTVETPCETSMPQSMTTTVSEVSSALPPNFSTNEEYIEWLRRRVSTLRTQLDVEKGRLVAYKEAVKAAKWRERRKLEAMK